MFKKSVHITDRNPTFYVKFCGKVQTFEAQGKGCTRGPVQKIWDHSAADEHSMVKVALTVSLSGLTMVELETKKELKFNIENISYCNADTEINGKIFSWIYKHHGSRKMECFAVLCTSKEKCKVAALVLSRAFHIAYKDWNSKKEKRHRQKLVEKEEKKLKQRLIKDGTVGTNNELEYIPGSHLSPGDASGDNSTNNTSSNDSHNHTDDTYEEFTPQEDSYNTYEVPREVKRRSSHRNTVVSQRQPQPNGRQNSIPPSDLLTASSNGQLYNVIREKKQRHHGGNIIPESYSKQSVASPTSYPYYEHPQENIPVDRSPAQLPLSQRPIKLSPQSSRPQPKPRQGSDGSDNRRSSGDGQAADRRHSSRSSNGETSELSLAMIMASEFGLDFEDDEYNGELEDTSTTVSSFAGSESEGFMDPVDHSLDADLQRLALNEIQEFDVMLQNDSVFQVDRNWMVEDVNNN